MMPDTQAPFALRLAQMRVRFGMPIALHTGWPHVAVPTPYAGSDSTAIPGQTENGRKTAVTDPGVQHVTSRLNAPMALRDLGLAVSVLDRAADVG